MCNGGGLVDDGEGRLAAGYEKQGGPEVLGGCQSVGDGRPHSERLDECRLAVFSRRHAARVGNRDPAVTEACHLGGDPPPSRRAAAVPRRCAADRSKMLSNWAEFIAGATPTKSAMRGVLKMRRVPAMSRNGIHDRHSKLRPKQGP